MKLCLRSRYLKLPWGVHSELVYIIVKNQNGEFTGIIGFRTQTHRLQVILVMTGMLSVDVYAYGLKTEPVFCMFLESLM